MGVQSELSWPPSLQAPTVRGPGSDTGYYELFVGPQRAGPPS